MENDPVPDSHENDQNPVENEPGAVPVPWYASVWFSLLMISLSMCSCPLTAIYPLFALAKNHRITDRQRRFVVTLGVIMGVLTLITTVVSSVMLSWAIEWGLHRLKSPWY